MPVKRRVEKRRSLKHTDVKPEHVCLDENGNGHFLDDEIAEAFGCFALINYPDLGETLRIKFKLRTKLIPC